MSNSKVIIRSEHLDGAEVSWFAPLCNGDDEFLGHHDIRYKSKTTKKVLNTISKLLTIHEYLSKRAKVYLSMN